MTRYGYRKQMWSPQSFVALSALSISDIAWRFTSNGRETAGLFVDLILSH